MANLTVGEVTPAPTGYPDLLARPVVVLQHQYPAAARTGTGSTH